MRSNTFILGDRTYDFAKKLVQIILPGFATLYLALSQIWALPYGDEVAKTVVVVGAFLGLLLGISNAQYNASGVAFDGHLTVEPNEELGATKVIGLHLDKVPNEIAGKSSITLKVESAVPEVEEIVEEEEDEAPPQNPATRRGNPSK